MFGGEVRTEYRSQRMNLSVLVFLKITVEAGYVIANMKGPYHKKLLQPTHYWVWLAQKTGGIMVIKRRHSSNCTQLQSLRCQDASEMFSGIHLDGETK